MLRKLRSERGFTLIELMVVILIIGILVAIAVPVFNAARENAYAKTCQANLRTLDGAVQTYKANDPSELWPTTLAALRPTYIKEMPKCPKNGNGYYYGTPGTDFDGTLDDPTQSATPTIWCPGRGTNNSDVSGYQNHKYY